MVTLKCIRGTDFRRVFTWREPDNPDGTPGDLIDLTGYDVTFTVTIGSYALALEIGDGITLTPLAGRVDIHIDDEVTSEFKRSGVWELTTTSPGGDIGKMSGNFRVS